MASGIRKIAFKSFILGLFFLALEFAYTYSRRYHLSRQQTQLRNGKLLAMPDTLLLKEKREQFLSQTSRNSTPMISVSEQRTWRNGTTIIRGRSSDYRENILPQRLSNGRKGILFREHKTVHVNLDSEAWNSSDEALRPQMDELRRALNSPDIQMNIACTNPIRHVAFERPVTKLSHGKFVVGGVDPELARYAVVSIGVDLHDRRTDSYAFYAPLTSLAWKRIDYGVIVIVAGTVSDWLALPVTRHVMSYLCQTGAVLFFLPTSKRKLALVGRASRLFVAPLLHEYYRTIGSTGPGTEAKTGRANPFLLLADVDLWVLQRHEFDTSSEIISLNNGCCQWFSYDGWRLKSWPLVYIGMRYSTWWEVLGGNTAISGRTQITSYRMVAIIRRRFDRLLKESTTGGSEAATHLPEFVLGLWLNGYMMTKGTDRVAFADRPGPRLEPGNPVVNGSSDGQFGSYFDVHLPRMARAAYKNDAWTRIAPLLRFMYGEGSVDLRWCVEYYSKYMTYIADYQRKVADGASEPITIRKEGQTKRTAESPDRNQHYGPEGRESSATHLQHKDYKAHKVQPGASQMRNQQPPKKMKMFFGGRQSGRHLRQRFGPMKILSPRMSPPRPTMIKRTRRKRGTNSGITPWL